MEHPVFDDSRSQTVLDQVHEDMRVCDSAGNEIGTVRQVFLGATADTPNTPGAGPATASTPGLRDETLVDQIAEIFSDDPLPEVLRDRLLREGFIRIDTHGLFASDRFALPDQIESVSDDCVRLRLAKDELIKH
ncbi:MAG TPA: hypothetical protein VK900_05840 [Anaerolineales bacterium]|nr:hypothetical protein [Anaerolineales bacterium]